MHRKFIAGLRVSVIDHRNEGSALRYHNELFGWFARCISVRDIPSVFRDGVT